MSQIILAEGAAASTPATGKVTIYAKTDGAVYSKDDAGAETQLGGGGGGGAPTGATYIVQTSNGSLSNEQALELLATGIVKNTTGTGVLSIAAAGTDYVAPGSTTSSGLTMATNRLLGRNTAATGAIEEIVLGTNLSFTGTTLNAAATGLADGDKGDITVSTSGATWTIDAGVVTYAKMQDISATDKLLGRSTAGSGDVEEITCTAAGRALLDDADASAQRTTLGLAIGTDVQAYVAPSTSGNVLTSNGSAWVSSAPAAGGYTGFRNKIIGGDFTTNPWQRGTSFTAINGYCADRWTSAASGTTAVLNALKTADAPTVAQAGIYTAHCLHLDVTTADAAIAAGDVFVIRQNIEGLNAASFGFGQTGTRYVTLSFWHKHTKTGTYCVSLRNSATDRSYVAEYTQDVTDTWEQATVTIAVDTSGTWLYDTGIGLSVSFALAGGSTFQTTANTWAAGNFLATANQVNALDSTANNFKIALVQLEAGSTATPFETRPYGTELALCQRYYYRVTGNSHLLSNSGYAQSTTSALLQTTFPVPMRIRPTAIEQSGTVTDYTFIYLATANNANGVPTYSGYTSEWAGVFTATTTAVFTAGIGVNILANSASAYLGWSAEL